MVRLDLSHFDRHRPFGADRHHDGCLQHHAIYDCAFGIYSWLCLAWADDEQCCIQDFYHCILLSRNGIHSEYEAWTLHGIVILGETHTGTESLTLLQKIPPRVTFAAQCAGILVSWLVQTAVNIWAMGNVRDVCTPNAENNVSHKPTGPF